MNFPSLSLSLSLLGTCLRIDAPKEKNAPPLSKCTLSFVNVHPLSEGRGLFSLGPSI